MHLDIRYIGYVTKIDKNWQIWSKIDRFDHFWSDAHTSIFRGMSVRIANTKSPFGAINSLRTIGQWLWIIVKSNTVSIFGVPPWLCLLEYCVLKLSCQSWQSITHSRNYIIVTYRLRNCNSWEFRMIIIYIQNPLYVQTSSASRPRGLNLVQRKTVDVHAMECIGKVTRPIEWSRLEGKSNVYFVV